jgi:hypothetical protein
MTASLSSKFLAELAQVYATLRLPALSAAFLSDLKKVHATLPGTSDDDLLFLAKRFAKWRSVTQEFVRARRAKLSEDDPLVCPISLFRTMDYGRLETAHTRALAWLLDPRREHGFGQTLLAALLCRLPGGDRSGALRVDRVESEYLIGGPGAAGRLDILVEGAWEGAERQGWVLVIEAKVDAGEGEDQLQRYETWLRAHAAGRKVFRVFLTPEGQPAETGPKHWEPLCFLELVRTFRSVYGALGDKPGFHFLRFYLAGVLQDVCHLRYNIAQDDADPYTVAAYLKTVHDSSPEVARHDATR